MKVVEGGLEHPQVIDLLQQHLEEMAMNSPPESIHALDAGALQEPGVHFFSLWNEGRLAGIAALKVLDSENAEIKSMRTHRRFFRQGVALKLVQHLISYSYERGYRTLWLETGSADEFKPARDLYLKCGFVVCAPFADYIPDVHSVFMTKSLNTLAY